MREYWASIEQEFWEGPRYEFPTIDEKIDGLLAFARIHNYLTGRWYLTRPDTEYSLAVLFSEAHYYRLASATVADPLAPLKARGTEAG